MQIEILQAEEDETKWNSGAFLLIFYVLVICTYLKDQVFKAKIITMCCETVNIYRNEIKDKKNPKDGVYMNYY